MARALIVGCGCRGRSLGAELVAGGWVVRGTSRTDEGLEAIREAGLEAARADPDRPAEVLDLVGDVTVVHWLLGGAQGPRDNLEAIHGPRLERLLEHLVDTPVRGFVYEASGSVDPEILRRGAAAVGEASARWRIPVSLLEAPGDDHEAWTREALAATQRALSG